MYNKISILVAGRSKGALEELTAELAGQEYALAQKHINNGHSDPLYGLEKHPDILVFHLSEQGEEELACLLDHPAEMRPATLVIGPAGNTSLMRIALQAGARDYLTEPLDVAELHNAMERLRKEFRQATSDTADGSLVAVVSAKGGAGASFVATNLAHMMSCNSAMQIALLDLDLQFGSLAQYLDLRPEHGLMTALDMAEHLDKVAVDAYMTKHESGIALLGPLADEVILSRDVSTERFGVLLDLLKDNYEGVVADLPRQIDDLSGEVYERADRILLVMQQELANLKDAVRLRNILVRELGVPRDRITVAVNRYEKNAAVELGDIARALGTEKEELVLVPNSYRSVADSVNMGIPMLDHARGSSVTKALMALESRLTGSHASDSGRSMISRAITQLMGG